MTVRTDVLWSARIPGGGSDQITVPSGERWIIKSWSLYGDTDVTTPSTRYILYVTRNSPAEIGVLFDSDIGIGAHDLIINGRGDHQAPNPWVVADAGTILGFAMDLVGNGHLQLWVSGTRLATV